jgi:CheY-like chemotaxis protein
MSKKEFQILIIEDQKSTADELKNELLNYAEIISVSGSPDRGLLRAKAYPYNCFIVNCGHDGKQGLIFVEKLKKLQELHNIPFLFTYKPNAKFDMALGSANLSYDILRLPIDKNELHWRFRKISGVKTVEAEKSSDPILPANHSNELGKLLLVEDNPLNQKVLGMFISKLGYDFDVASNGQMAIDLCAEKQYKYILMDIFMPGMDGTEATEKIREMEKKGKHKAKIIAISANESEDGIQKCYDSGMNDYLVKPFTLEILREKLV